MFFEIPLKKKLLFLTGTRADFGKMKSLIANACAVDQFEVHVFVTGMHMLSSYGFTCEEVEKCGFPNIHKFINQNCSDGLDAILSKTIQGLSDFVKEIAPDMIVIHGDRVEAMAGAIVGSFNNILVTHIEGGEVSGTIDELIRHSVSKLAHLHLVSNDQARDRLLQLGEEPSSIFVIGSPDMDLMASANLPTLAQVRSRYDLAYDRYGIVLFHPVTTEMQQMEFQANEFVNALLRSEQNYLVVYPNNDPGSQYILDAYKRLVDKPRFRIIPSLRFEYFLTALKNAEFIIGNSSAGVREAPFYGVPCIDCGSRQHNRAKADTIIHSDIDQEALLAAIEKVQHIERGEQRLFGHGNSAEMFREIICCADVWRTSVQKQFIDQA